MLPFIMIVASPTQISLPLLRARRLPRPGRGIGVHPERLGAFSSLLSSSNISTFKPSNPQTVPSPSPFPATLTTRVKHKSFACHSYKKHPGVGGCHVQFFRGTDFSLCSFATVYFGNSRSEGTAGIEKSRRPASLQSRVASCGSGSLFHKSPVTNH